MSSPDDVRQITDTRVLAAMAHPLRWRLMDVLKVDGPATASALATRTGQHVGNISHHLRALAAAHLVEEVPELARDRRERWWRLTSPSLRWTTRDFVGDPATEAVALAVESLGLDQQLARLRAWATAGDAVHAQWVHGPFSTERWVRVTDQELAELSEEIVAVLRRWSDRELPDDGQQRHDAYVFARGVPASP